MTARPSLRLVVAAGLAIAVAVVVTAHVIHQRQLSHRAVDPTTPFRCPARQGDLDLAGTDSLPPGATQAMLCVRDNHVPWYPPPEVLHLQVAALAALVNAQPVHDPHSDDACGGVGAPAFAMVFRYAGGTRTVTGDTGGCWDLLVGSTQRSGSRQVFDAYLADLAKQRASTTPSPGPVRAMCPSARVPPFAPLADPARITGAVLCPSPGVALSRAQLGVLRRDLATLRGRTGVEPGPRCRRPVLRGPVSLSAVDAWGDRFTIGVSCGLLRVDAYRDLVRPLPATQRMLVALIAERGGPAK